MVKGVSRRVVVVESPDTKLFEQAIFIVRNDAAHEGVTSRALVEEARRVARDYADGETGGRFRHRMRGVLWALLGAAVCGLVWLAVSMGM